jgi:hypothetical protein
MSVSSRTPDYRICHGFVTTKAKLCILLSKSGAGDGNRTHLAGIQPQAAALMTKIDVEVPEMQDKQRDITFWTDASHVVQNLVRNDGASGADASSTSRVTTVSGSRSFITR